MSPRKCPAEIRPQIGPQAGPRPPPFCGGGGCSWRTAAAVQPPRAAVWPAEPVLLPAGPPRHRGATTPARPPVGPPPSRVVSLPGISPGRGGSASFEPLDPVSALASVQACVLFPSDSRSSSLRLCQREALCTPQRDPEPSPCFRRGWSPPQGVWPLPSK